MKTDSPDVLLPEQFSTLQAEQSVISILLSFESAIDAIGNLRPEHFSDPRARAIFGVMLRQFADGKGASIVTLHDELKGSITLPELHEIAICHDYSARPAARFAQQIIDSSKARQLYAAADRISGLAFDEGPIADRVDRAQAELAKLCDDEAESDWVSSYEAALAHTELLERRQSGEVAGIPTGLHDLDEMLDGGMNRGNLIIIGARPSHGKTALGLSAALNVARAHSVGFLSMEMSVSELMDRQAASLGTVPLSFIKRPQKGLDYSRILDAVEMARTLQLHLYDRPALNILQVKRLARALRRRKGLDVLVVDYLGLMSPVDPKQERRIQLGEMTRGLKALAKELDIAVVCLSQLSRAGADRANKRPQLTDLRESGDIEQDADVVLFIHRPEMDNPNCDAKFKNYAQLFVAKNRQGRCGDVHLHYAGENTRFTSWGGEPPTETVVRSSSKGFGGAG